MIYELWPSDCNEFQLGHQLIKNKGNYHMNKSEFEKYIAEKHSITRKEASNMIDIFTSSVISALGEGNEILLVGFGNFSVSNVAARMGRNLQTGEPMQIKAYKQPRFKVGKKLKDAVNK